MKTKLRILLAPNAYKGSLTASEAARAMEEGVRRVSNAIETTCIPLADGGDGTLETLVATTNGSLLSATVHDPLGRLVQARWGRLGGERGDVAVIEMAEASGLRLLKPQERNPLQTTTYGVGELMKVALEAGCRSLLIGIGGSATNDGGAGMAQALGAKLLDAEGKEIPWGGEALSRLSRIDLTNFSIPPSVLVRVACDVNNPLCGSEGAAAIYGPQKGATPEMVRLLDANLTHFAKVLRRDLGRDVEDLAGAGAAGGLGAGLLAFCNAEMLSGIELAMEATGFDTALLGCHLVLTGEGSLDGQTGRGKAIAGIVQRAKAHGVPVVAIAGALEAGAEERLRSAGLTTAFSLLPAPMTTEEAMQNAYALLSDASERATRLFCAGANLTEFK